MDIPVSSDLVKPVSMTAPTPPEGGKLLPCTAAERIDRIAEGHNPVLWEDKKLRPHLREVAQRMAAHDPLNGLSRTMRDMLEQFAQDTSPDGSWGKMVRSTIERYDILTRAAP